ncbi:hypothetical protein B296_00051086, partial [Ensete ventricosum]
WGGTAQELHNTRDGTMGCRRWGPRQGEKKEKVERGRVRVWPTGSAAVSLSHPSICGPLTPLYGRQRDGNARLPPGGCSDDVDH